MLPCLPTTTLERRNTDQELSQVARDENNLSKGYGFVSFTAFEASDDAIANMHGQYMMNKEITVQYAYKKDGKGERHGDQAERALAASGRTQGVEVTVQPLPPQLFTAGAPSAPAAMANGAPPPMMDPRAQAGMYAQSPVTPGGMGMGYNSVPPPQQQRTQTPLQPPPAAAGVPARPPPSAAGYNGPQGFAPPGFGAPPGMPPNGFAPPSMPPAGFAPPGFGAPPPGMPPNGYGMPPGMPPGAYQQRR